MPPLRLPAHLSGGVIRGNDDATPRRRRGHARFTPTRHFASQWLARRKSDDINQAWRRRQHAVSWEAARRRWWLTWPVLRANAALRWSSLQHRQMA